MGKFVWGDGAKYEGEVHEGDLHGRGIYVWTDNRKYDGDWKHNIMDGHATFTWMDGRQYIGEYQNDKKHGYGEFTWPNGKIYKGMWKDGKQDGDGLLMNSKTGEELKSSWVGGQRVGAPTDKKKTKQASFDNRNKDHLDSVLSFY